MERRPFDGSCVGWKPGPDADTGSEVRAAEAELSTPANTTTAFVAAMCAGDIQAVRALTIRELPRRVIRRADRRSPCAW